MPDRGLTRRDLYAAIIFAAVVYLAMQFVRQIVDVILLFSITALLVVSLSPLVTWLERKKVPRGASATCMALLVLGSVGLLIYIILPPLERQVADLGRQLPKLIGQVQNWLAGFERAHPSLAQYLPKADSVGPSTFREAGSYLAGGISRIGASAAALVASVFLVFISTVYSLANPKPLAEGFLKAFRPGYRERVEAAGARLSAQIFAWAKGNIIAMAAIFALTWIALSIVGLKQAFLFAIIAGLLEAVPIVGPILSAIPPTLVALATNPIMAVWVIVAFIVIQQFENHILVPMVMSRQLSLHPVTVIFWVLVMGGLFGIVGVFLATPTAATAGVLYDELYIREYSKRHDGPKE
ncbi:MAG: AI-2E family transporter [Armatimonadetes bacterium]|nr:AI-2E family transporter [Armatimonadota bacterium]